jgi:cyclic beta-1,2-glucan synthetase
MYRVALESVLGVRIEAGTTLVVAPCIPDQWPGFRVRLRLPGDATQYEVAVENPGRTSARVVSVTADGKAAQVESGSARVPLVRDGGRHDVRIVLGAG